MKILNYTWDRYLERFGIYKKLRSCLYRPASVNKKNNLYLAHCQKILIKHIGSYSQNGVFIRNHSIVNKNFRRINYGYFSFARWMINNNPSYLVKHMLKLDSKLGRNRNLKDIRHLMKEVYKKTLKGSLKIEFKRKWLQAPAPKCRSLTIPSVVDRIISSMWTEILELYLKGTINYSHHGYQENKGCNTALIDLYSKQGKYDYIYEFDLENFFPSVPHSYLWKVLYDLGVPAYMIIYFLLPLQTKPTLDLELEVKDYQTGKDSYIFSSIYEKINYKGEANYVLGKGRDVGVPMGLGYSPLLAILVLGKILDLWKNSDNSYVTYADDGILMSQNKGDIKKFQELCLEFGLKVNEKKSRFIKDKDSVSSYKFLGIIYNNDNNICSSTRKGTSIDFFGNIIELIEQGAFSTILARLYSEVEDVKQDFRLFFKKDTVLHNFLGYFITDPVPMLRSNFVKYCWLNNPLSVTLNYVQRSYMSIRRRFSNPIYHKWSGLEWELQQEKEKLNIFNHSTFTSNKLTTEALNARLYTNKSFRTNLVDIVKIYSEKWERELELIKSEQNCFGRALLSPQGPIYENQIGIKNFNMLVKEFSISEGWTVGVPYLNEKGQKVIPTNK